MIIRNLSDKDYATLALGGVFFVALAVISFLLALFGFFQNPFLITAIIILSGGTLRLAMLGKIKLTFSRELIFIFVFTISISVIFSFFTTPTIFSGRDQGSISEAAIRLAQNHTLEWSTSASNAFFEIYKPGKALNFPGFYYTQNGNLITQFPIPYIAWLALFYTFFGLTGLTIANAVLFFIFLLFFYTTFRLYSEKIHLSFLAIATLSTAFPIFWFFKFTLSENLAIALLWFSLFSLVLFIKHQSKLNFFIMFSSFGLLFFTRIEGILFFIFGIMLAIIFTRKSVFWHSKEKAVIVLSFISFFVIASINASKNFYFYKEILKALINSGKNLDFVESGSILTTIVSKIELWWNYGMIGIFLFGILGVLFFFKNKKYLLLLPLLLTFPTFFYLIDGQISADHPWMFRRLMFSVFPILAFYSFLLLDQLIARKNRMIAYSAIILFLSLNSAPFYLYNSYSENQGLLDEIKVISQNFSSRDLVLIDQKSSGDGWNMISEPMNFLFGKQTAYFFNPDDYAKINLSKFNNVYLVTPSENVPFYQKSALGPKMQPIKEYSIQTRRLTVPKESLDLPEPTDVYVQGMIYKIEP